jgi:hypothetical protein
LVGYHDDCLWTIEEPDVVLAGHSGSRRSVKNYGRNRYLIVVYRELSKHDGFVITAYFVREIKRSKVLWQR